MSQRKVKCGRLASGVALTASLLAASLLAACDGLLMGAAPVALMSDAAIALDTVDAGASAEAQPPACEPGLERCGEQCMNTQEDPEHCGACSNACPAGQICRQGACGCAEGFELARERCCPVRAGEKTVWCEPFDTFDATLWQGGSNFDGATAVQDGKLVLERSGISGMGLHTIEAYGYGIYRCRFRVASGKLQSKTSFAFWQWGHTGNAPTGTFNEIDAIEIFSDDWGDSSLPKGGSAGTAYRNNLWIKCSMDGSPAPTCQRGANVYPKQAINDGNWHELQYKYFKSLYELSIDGHVLRTITDTRLPVPPMNVYTSVNSKVAASHVRVELDDCSYSVEATQQQ